LPDSGSYTDYVDLKRETTLWLLSAAPAYSLKPRRWCYLFVGCFNYRGYFSRRQADAEAARLSAKGWDVALVPGLAYSTLGFSNDPVLSTMLRYSDPQLVGVLFHELAHELLYVRNDSTFNESFATAVETIGRQRWARSVARAGSQQAAGVGHALPTGGIGAQSKAQSQAALRRRQYDDLGRTIRQHLQQAYAEAADGAPPAAEKIRIFEDFADRHEALKSRWNGQSPIDHWFDGEGPNNARIALFSTYELEVPALLEVFRQCGEQLSCFYAEAEMLARLEPADRRARLKDLGQQASRYSEGLK